MENTTQKTNIRWLYLAVGTFAMLFAGILYAWSILKAPFSVEFGWSPSDLTLNFTITMSFFAWEAFWAPRYPSVWVPVLPLSFQAFWPLAVLP